MGKIIFAIIVFVALMALVAYWMIAAARRNSCRKSLSGNTCSQVKQRVRVAYISSNAILLCPRDESAALRGDNLDLPFETLIGRHEKVNMRWRECLLLSIVRIRLRCVSVSSMSQTVTMVFVRTICL